MIALMWVFRMAFPSREVVALNKRFKARDRAGRSRVLGILAAIDNALDVPAVS